MLRKRPMSLLDTQAWTDGYHVRRETKGWLDHAMRCGWLLAHYSSLKSLGCCIWCLVVCWQELSLGTVGVDSINGENSEHLLVTGTQPFDMQHPYSSHHEEPWPWCLHCCTTEPRGQVPRCCVYWELSAPSRLSPGMVQAPLTCDLQATCVIVVMNLVQKKKNLIFTGFGILSFESFGFGCFVSFFLTRSCISQACTL